MSQIVKSQENVFQTVSENWAFVGIAYVLTFGVWTGITGNDFISSTWKSVEETRKRGLWHLCLTTIPMLYMTVYMTIQGLGKDFKEMWTAFVAFVFALLHMLRTICGLWQLHCFKQWLIASIKCLESLGYYASNCKGKNCSAECLNKKQESSSVICPLDEGSQDDRINRRADAVLVNDILVDNRLSEGDVTCYLRFEIEKQRETESSKANLFRQRCLKGLYFLRSMRSIPYLLWTIARSRTSSFTNPRSLMYLQPRQPEEIWLGWACVLIAEVFPQWLADMKEAKMDFLINEDEDEGYDACRAQFARGVLLSAGLHAQHSCSVIRTIENDTRNRILRKDKFPPLRYWDRERYPQLCNGLFCKQEFVNYACKSGTGLPFSVQHTNARSLDHGLESYGYSRFAAKLDRKRESLPAETGEKIKGFGVNELEWLAVFLSIPDWNTVNHQQTTAESLKSEIGKDPSADPASTGAEHTFLESKKSIVQGVSSNEQNNEKDKTGISTSDGAYGEEFSFGNLREQLGFKDTFEGFTNEELMRSFPLLRQCVSRALWDNRNLLEVSIHIDNFLALSSGGHVSHMLDLAPLLKERSLWKTPPATVFSAPSECTAESSSVLEEGFKPHNSSPSNMWNAHSELVNESLMYQLALEKPEYKHLEQSMTFLGCCVERLRTFLARWAAKNPENSDLFGAPSIRTSRNILGREEEPVFRFRLSGSFESLLNGLKCPGSFKQRFLQMQLLWELQSYFQGSLPRCGISPDTHEAMILCVLSFPAIEVKIKGSSNNMATDEAEAIEGRGNCSVLFVKKYSLEVRAVCSPQDVHIDLTLENQENLYWYASVQLVAENEADDSFAWEAWREAFGGRLEGTRSWQERHSMYSVPVNLTWKGIESGVELIRVIKVGTGTRMNVWTGWMPLRTAVSQFELESSGLILERREVRKNVEEEFLCRVGRHASAHREKRSSVSYSSASKSELQLASLVAHEAIRKLCKSRNECLLEFRVSVKDIEEKASEMLTCAGRTQRRRGLLLTEVIATEITDFSVARKAVKILAGKEASAGDIWRALSMIEGFRFSWSMRGKEISRNKHVTNRNGTETAEILEFQKSLLGQTKHESAVSEWYALICSSLSSSPSRDIGKEIYPRLYKSIIRATAGDIADTDRARSILASWLPSESEDQCTLSVRILFRKDLQKVSVARIVDSAQKLLWGRAVARNHVLGMKLFDYVVEEKADANAMVRLGQIFYFGLGGVLTDRSKAKRLFQSAAQRGSAEAMINLAWYLGEEEPFIREDAPRAVELLSRAIQNKIPGAEQVVNNVLSSISTGLWKESPHAVEQLLEAVERNGKYNSKIKAAELLKHDMRSLDPLSERANKMLKLAIEESKDLDALNVLLRLAKEDLLQQMLGARLPDAIKKLVDVIETSEDLSARIKLARLLRIGAMNIPADPARAIYILSSVTDELAENSTSTPRGNWGVAWELEKVLRDVEKGHWTGAPRTVERCIIAIERFGSSTTKIRAARLLQSGASGLSADPVRVTELLKHAIDEAELYTEIDEITHIITRCIAGKGIFKNISHIVERMIEEIEIEGSLSLKIRLSRVLINESSNVREYSATGINLLSDAVDELLAHSVHNSTTILKGIDGLEEILKDVASNRWTGAPKVTEHATRAIEKHGTLTAKLQLAELLRDGAKGLLPNLARAVEILKNVIDESVNRREMNYLEQTFEKFKHGSWADSACAVEYIVNAIEKHGSLTTKHQLAEMLKCGTKGLLPDAARAVEILKNVIDESVSRREMKCLEKAFESVKSGLWAGASLAVECIVHAVEAYGSLTTRIKLAKALRNGAPGLLPNFQRASDALARVKNECATDSNIDNDVQGIAFIESIEEGHWADASAAIRNVISAIAARGTYPEKIKVARVLKTGAPGLPADASRAAEIFAQMIDGCGRGFAPALIDRSRREFEHALISHFKMLLETVEEGLWANAPLAVDKLLKNIAERGNCSLKIRSARMLKNGAVGVPVQASRALEMLDDVIDEYCEVDQVDLLQEIIKDASHDERLFADAEGVIERLVDALEDTGSMHERETVAKILKNGANGVRDDAPRAVRLYLRAIKENCSVNAMVQLGLLVENGRRGVPANATLACHHYNEAVAKGSSRACFCLAVLMQHGSDGVVKHTTRAAQLYTEAMKEDGNSRTAANNLAVLLEQGSEGLPADIPRAIELYRQAIGDHDSPHSGALYNLAVLLKRGANCVPADPVEALELYSRAVAAGSPVCPQNLQGDLSLSSICECEADMGAEALRYIAAIEDDNDVRAMHNLAVLLQFGATGVPADPQRAVRLYTRAALEGGHVGAMDKLAKVLQEGGQGVPVDASAAAWWLARSRQFNGDWNTND